LVSKQPFSCSDINEVITITKKNRL